MQFSSQNVPVSHENSCKCLCGVLVIICEIYMWLNGYFTSSTIVVVCFRHPCRCPPLLSAVLVIHFLRLSVCQKSAPPHFTHYISSFPLQNSSAIYPLQHPHICSPHFTIAKNNFGILWATCGLVTVSNYIFNDLHSCAWHGRSEPLSWGTGVRELMRGLVTLSLKVDPGAFRGQRQWSETGM